MAIFCGREGEALFSVPGDVTFRNGQGGTIELGGTKETQNKLRELGFEDRSPAELRLLTLRGVNGRVNGYESLEWTFSTPHSKFVITNPDSELSLPREVKP